MKTYDIAVIGAGPAGCMAAIRGAQLGKNVILLERNNKIGRKLLLTGHGRCNITNAADLDVFLEKFGPSGSFYSDAFNRFSNKDLVNFFESHDLSLKEFEGGRIFPGTEKSKSVVNVLKKVLGGFGVEILYNYRLKHLYKQYDGIFKLFSTEDELITAHNIVMATGGISYGFTGSTGDGLTIAESLGHHITKLKPGGVPLIVTEEWVPELKGITLGYVGLKIQYGEKVMHLPSGELLFTKYGVSGPVILDMSQVIVEIMEKHGEVKLFLDFKPEMEDAALRSILLEDFHKFGEMSLRNYFKNYLPEKMIDPILKAIYIDPQKRLDNITEKEILQLQEVLKSFPLTITGYLPLDKALVTCGGVSIKEIAPQTMESKFVKRLYFAGEIIELCGRRGGYNLQQAFSTGYVAGNSASED